MQLAVKNHILLLIDDEAQYDETPTEDPMEDDPSGKGLVDVSTLVDHSGARLPNSSDMQTFLADKQHSNVIREMAQSNASVSKKSVTFRKAECLEQQLTLKRTPGTPSAIIDFLKR
jgi:hypothetical protein